MARYGDNHKGGRPKGCTNLTNDERHVAIAFARSVVNDAEYRANFLRRARLGQLGAMEQTLWAYAWGKPLDRIEVNIKHEEDLTQLSVEELARRATELSTQLDEAKALAEAIPAEYLLTEPVEPVEQESKPLDHANPPEQTVAQSDDVLPLITDANASMHRTVQKLARSSTSMHELVQKVARTTS